MDRTAGSGAQRALVIGCGCMLVSLLGCVRSAPPTSPPRPPTVAHPVFGWAHLPELQPAVPSSLGATEASLWIEAWLALSGDRLDDAYRLASTLVHSHPRLSDARSLLGLIELRADRGDAATAHFDAAFGLADHPRAMALAETGIVLTEVHAGRELAAYERLERLRRKVPESTVVSALHDELRIDLAERWVREGRKHRPSNPLMAATALEKALRYTPEATDLYLELASTHREAGAGNKAVTTAERAVSLESDYLPALKLYAELLEENEQNEEALETYQAAAALAPFDTKLAERAQRLAHQLRLHVPASELARIRSSASLTREDLSAVLIGALGELLESAPRQRVIVTDVEDSWARAFILESLSLGLQRAYPNHTFEPKSRVSKAELRHALRQGACWVDAVCGGAGATCGRSAAASPAQPLVQDLLASSSRVTGELAVKAAEALAEPTGSCRR